MGLDITGLGSIFDFGSKIIDKIFPDKNAANAAKLEMLKVQQAGEFKELELEYQAMAQQAAVNLEEAKNPNWFVSGWRPYVGWVCGTGLLYTFLGRPILVSCGVHAPEVDVSVLIELLLGLLGMAGFRTYEKINHVARK